MVLEAKMELVGREFAELIIDLDVVESVFDMSHKAACLVRLPSD